MRRLTAAFTIAIALAARTAAGQPAAPYDAPPPAAAAPPPPPEGPPPQQAAPPPPPPAVVPLPAPRLVLPPPRLIAPPAASPSPEVGLGMAQTLVGAGAMFLGVTGLVVVTAKGAPSLTAGAILLGPALAGLVVCGLGRTSDAYDGGCGAPIAFAYLGALLAIPAAFLGCSLDRPSASGTSDGEGCLGGAIAGVLIGYFIGPPLAATLIWHAAKHPRGADAQAWLDLAPRPADRGAAGSSRVSTTLLALEF